MEEQQEQQQQELQQSRLMIQEEHPMMMQPRSRPEPIELQPMQPSSVKIVMDVLNTITHLALGAVAFSAISYVNRFDLRNSFTIHIYMCTVGYIILMSTAIMAYNPSASWSRNLLYQQKKISHIVLQIIGSTIAITGSIIRMVNLNNHFQTPHAILGFTAMILTAISLIGGVLNLIIRRRRWKTSLKTLHSGAGVLTLIIAFTTLCLGFGKTSITMGSTNVNLSIILTIIAAVGIVLPACANITARVYR